MATIIAENLKWHLSVIPPATQKALDWLSKQKWLKQSAWYLAGGTALALQVGHRTSVDLDFFLPQADFNQGKLLEHFKKTKWQSTLIKEGTIYGELAGAKISFIAYPFFVSSEEHNWYGNVRVLLPKDVAVMKIIAISQRGKKRDFYDLYWYCQNREPLLDIILRLSRQYPNLNHNYHHIITSLSYFADAENDPEPRLAFSVSWLKVKRFFIGEAKKLMKDFKLI